MPNFYNPYQYYPQQQQQPQAQPQIQNGGFISVRSEQEARNYPVAIGNSVTFRDETAPYVYTKTMGFSQLDRPIFEKYKLVKEEVAEEESKIAETSHEEIESLRSDIKKIWSEINAIKRKPRSEKNGDN